MMGMVGAVREAVARLHARVEEGRKIDGDTPSRVQTYATADVEAVLDALSSSSNWPVPEAVAWRRKSIQQGTGAGSEWVLYGPEDAPHYNSATDRYVIEALGVLSSPPPQHQARALVIESILLRRLAANRIDGFTLETAAEIVAAIRATGTLDR